MSHRFAMERGKMLAGFACHGGELNCVNSESPLRELKARFNIFPVPAFLTMGDRDDVWYAMGKDDFEVWGTWNECSKEQSENIKFGDTDVIQIKKSNCKSGVETVWFEIKNGYHAPDAKLAEPMWDFLKNYKRSSATSTSQTFKIGAAILVGAFFF